jgi:predicted O-methyltransferase YrrM
MPLNIYNKPKPPLILFYWMQSRSYYPNYWNDLKRLMRKNGGVLMVDNVISHAAEVKAFLNMIKQDGDF